MNDKTIIGRIEEIDLPEFGIFGIEAKIDTGAFNSAIHCTNVVEKEIDGKKVLQFTFLDETHPQFNGKFYEAYNFRKSIVRRSNTSKDRRYQIKTVAVIAGREVEMILNLSNRSGMSMSVLVGRSSLSGNFLVDVSKKV